MRRWTERVVVGVLGLMWVSAGCPWAAEEQLHYYIGEKACRSCHGAVGSESPDSVWRSSDHAKAYGVLTMPEAFEIAELSGVDVHPQKSPICLGCHTTAPTVEEWELDEGFHRQDGVQCEACHGPGSDYSPADVMADRERAMEAGLMMPTEEDCMCCHIEKGTHVAIVGSKEFDVKKAMKRIAHSPGLSMGEAGQEESTVPADSLAKPHYVGVWSCAECHSRLMIGDQVSVWRRNKHAEAYAVLGTKKAEKIAKEKGLEEHPQKSPQCLKCHSTGIGEPVNKFGPDYEKVQGVTCEACHGAGSEYQLEAIMLDPRR